MSNIGPTQVRPKDAYMSHAFDGRLIWILWTKTMSKLQLESFSPRNERQTNRGRVIAARGYSRRILRNSMVIIHASLGHSPRS